MPMAGGLGLSRLRSGSGLEHASAILRSTTSTYVMVRWLAGWFSFVHSAGSVEGSWRGRWAMAAVFAGRVARERTTKST
jgi:hypothetical protein